MTQGTFLGDAGGNDLERLPSVPDRRVYFFLLGQGIGAGVTMRNAIAPIALLLLAGCDPQSSASDTLERCFASSEQAILLRQLTASSEEKNILSSAASNSTTQKAFAGAFISTQTNSFASV
jgi:hypothetical protein